MSLKCRDTLKLNKLQHNIESIYKCESFKNYLDIWVIGNQALMRGRLNDHRRESVGASASSGDYLSS